MITHPLNILSRESLFLTNSPPPPSRLLHHKPARWAGGFPEQRPRSRIAMLECIIYELHSCPSQHIETAPVCEASQGITLWAGHVEVFAIIGHLRTERCYAWIERIGRR